MKASKSLILFLLFAIGNNTSLIIAQNPLVPNVGMADPHIHIFNNKAYLYATKDKDSLSTSRTWNMPEWQIWSSPDLTNWSLETTIKPEETYIGEPSIRCWAPDAAYKNNSYYFYFSNWHLNTGVMKSSSPGGPFVDALGKPLLEEDLTGTDEYDPTLFTEDDANLTTYIAFGRNRMDETRYFYSIAKLNDDMISLAEEPKEIIFLGTLNGYRGYDKPTIHKYKHLYYLSSGSWYATSTNIYGPYTMIGNSGNNNEKYGLTRQGHGNYFEWRNQWFHVWCQFVWGREVAFYRESKMTYLHYKNNGDMVDDVNFLEKHYETGVGQYDANWDKIETEWYMGAENVMKFECPNGGFEIQQIFNNGHLFFPNMANLSTKSSITFHVSSANEAKEGTIEVRENSKEGKLLGSCEVLFTGKWTEYTDITCEINPSENTKDLYFVFKGKSGNLFHIDWFSFN